MKPSEATRADALALFRAREFDAVLSRRARWSRRSAGRCARWASIPTAGGRVRFDTGEREGKRSRAFCAPVRVPRRGVSRAASARRADRLAAPSCTSSGTRCTSRTCAPTIRWSSLAGRQLGDRRRTRCCSTTCMQDSGWLRRYTGLGKKTVAGVSAHGRIRGAALPAPLLREADLRDAALWRRRAVGRAARPVRRDAHGRDDLPVLDAPTRSSTSIRGTTRRAICARGSCRR